MPKISRYFNREDFACQCGCGVGNIAWDLVHKLELLRREVGAIIVTSGCRCRTHNDKVGGGDYSLHLSGDAADIYCPCRNLFELFVIATRYFEGVGLYPLRNIIHVDLRERHYWFITTEEEYEVLNSKWFVDQLT